MHEPKIERALALGQAEVEEAPHQAVGDLGGGGVHQLVEGRAGRERLHEVLVVEDALPDLLQLVQRQVEQRPALELPRVDPVGQAGQRDPGGPQLAHQLAGVDGGLRQRGGLDHDDHIVEVAELAAVLDVALDVRRVRRAAAPASRWRTIRAKTA